MTFTSPHPRDEPGKFLREAPPHTARLTGIVAEPRLAARCTQAPQGLSPRCCSSSLTRACRWISL